VRNYLLKWVQTMTISKVPWRKPPIPKQVAVICTRLILQAVFPAVIETRNSEGFCEDNLLLQMSEQNSQGRGKTDPAYNSHIHPSRIRQTILCCLPKSMVGAVPTHASAVTKSDIQFQRKRGCCQEGLHPLINYLDL